jgi:hypothetical protein
MRMAEARAYDRITVERFWLGKAADRNFMPL